jgi:DNA-directed RNA polymerase subunit RPC12/RpoP
MGWNGVNNIGSTQYTCGHCGNIIATGRGFFSDNGQRIYICPHCDGPTHFDAANRQFPDVAPGNDVGHLPDELSALYTEARNCVAASAYTGSVLLCRKLLMNIGVKQGADEGKPFIYYVDYLAEQGFIPPNGRGWVDHIRKKGNEATHEIALMSKGDCDDLIAFSEMLMKFIYEFPNKVPEVKS